MSLNEFINEVRASIREDIIVTGEEMHAFSRDWWTLLMLRELLGHVIDKPPLVLRPVSLDELRGIVKIANKHGICLVPFGGGSSVVGGSYHSSCVVVDMKGLNKIIDFNEEDLTITVEAGAKVADIEGWLNERGYTLDFHPQSFNLLTIGGAIAHGATGSHSLSNIEELVLSMEILLSNGDMITVGPGNYVRASWPDLRRLFIGSDGTLGIVVKATLKVKPLANHYIDKAYIFMSMKDAISFAKDFVVKLPGPWRIVIHDEDSSRLMIGEDRNIALVRFRGYYGEIVAAEANTADGMAKVHGGVEVEQEFVRKWRVVFSREYENQLMQLVNSGLWVETIDMATTWSRLLKLYLSIKEGLKGIDGVVYVLPRITHVYLNGASLYTVVVFKQDEEVYWRIWQEAFEVAHSVGATITHHHGTGLLKRGFVKEEMKGQLNILKLIKGLLDSKNILNPGKLLE